MKHESRTQKYPLFHAFGDRREAGAGAGPESDIHDRIRSIWPFMVRKVTQFYESLRPREQANCDPEDMLAELYIMLIEKDGQWEPERGKYITYAGKLIVRELLAIRDRARTVQSPRNATSRLKEYRASAEKGDLTDRRRETYGQLSRTVENARPMPSNDLIWLVADDHVGEVAEKDVTENELRLMRKAIRKLSPVESFVLGYASGLWGSGHRSHQEIADKIGRDVEFVREVKAAAYAKVRWYVNARRKKAMTASQ